MVFIKLKLHIKCTWRGWYHKISGTNYKKFAWYKLPENKAEGFLGLDLNSGWN